MSSYLIGFVKDLLENADAQVREEKRQQLEQSYHEAGQMVETMLKGQHEQLSTVVNAYSVISQRIKASRAGIQKVKEDLQSCKKLLYCKRDELRKPWLDHVCNSRVVELVEKIDAVRDAPDRIQVMISKKYFGRATNILLSAEAILPNELEHVKALDAVRTELTLKRKSLFTAVEEELKRQIYMRAADEMFSRFQRSESLRLSSATGRGSGRSWQHTGGGSRAFTLDTASLSSSGTAGGSGSGGGGGGGGGGASDPLFRWQEVDLEAHSFEEREGCVPEANRARLLVVLVEAAHRLGRLPQLVGRLRDSLPAEVLKVVQRAYNEVVNSAAAFGDYSPLSNINHPRYLVEFVEIICEVMIVIVHAHQLVLRKIGALQEKLKGTGELNDLPIDFNSRFVWSMIQNQLQRILDENLDMGHGTHSSGETGQSVDLKSMDIHRMELKGIDANHMFGAPKWFKLTHKNQRSSLPLFSFGASVEGRSFRENRHNIAETPDFSADHDADSVGSLDLLLCRPSHTNIQAIYVPLFDFLKTIEREMSTEQCQLRRFVVEFIETKYLKEVQDNLLNRIRQTPVDFLGIVDQKTQKDLGLTRPILQCALTMNNCLLEIKGLATSLPDYTSQCMDIAFAALDAYKEIVGSYQQKIVRERNSPSGPWSEDPDVVRFLKSYPSYRRMMAALASEVCTRDGDQPAYSEEESRQRTAQENDQILSMLESEWATVTKEKSAVESEMLHHADSLQRMAHHHESLAWLCSQLTQLSGWLVGLRQEEQVRVDEAAARRLLAFTEAFRERSDAALIMIRLECRVRAFCFYRHNPREIRDNCLIASYWCHMDTDTDAYVSSYLQDLSKVGNKLTTALQYHKTRYIFDGLGHFISILLINTLEHITRVNDIGVKKMSRNIFALHQALVTLTNGHESELLRTKHIYESLMTPPETLLTGIMEHGMKYDLDTYSQILKIYQRSHPTKDQRKFVEYEKRLQDYFSMSHV